MAGMDRCGKSHSPPGFDPRTIQPVASRCIARSKRDGTREETRFGLSAKRSSPLKSAGVSVQSTTGSRGMRISGQRLYIPCSDVPGKAAGYPLHSLLSPSLPLPCVTVYHQVPKALYQLSYPSCTVRVLKWNSTLNYSSTRVPLKAKHNTLRVIAFNWKHLSPAFTTCCVRDNLSGRPYHIAAFISSGYDLARNIEILLSCSLTLRATLSWHLYI